MPFLLKDLGAEAVDYPGHNGSRLLRDTVWTRDSAIWERIRATGVVCFGRTTAPEGGIGAATEAAVYGGPTRNPWNPDHTSGGSSGVRVLRWRRESSPWRMVRTAGDRCGFRPQAAGFSASSRRGRGCRTGLSSAKAGRGWRSTAF
ncbi:hypothetical protein MASR1M32_36630 [Rhodobacter sp.]